MQVTVKEFKTYALRVLRKTVVTWDDNETITDMVVKLTHQGVSIGHVGMRLFELVYQKHLRTSIHNFQHKGRLSPAQKRLRAFASHKAIEERTRKSSLTGIIRAWGRRCFPHRRFTSNRDLFGYGSNGRLATVTASGAGTRVPPALRSEFRKAQTGNIGSDLILIVVLLGLFGAHLVGKQHKHELELLEKSQRHEAQETRFVGAAASVPESTLTAPDAAD